MDASNGPIICFLSLEEMMYIYCTGPIDDWIGWTELHQLRGTAQRAEALQLRKSVMPIFRANGWEGDGDWYISGLPPCEKWFNPASQLLIAVKQSNNGTVFIASPYKLPWIKSYRVRRLPTAWPTEHPDEPLEDEPNRPKVWVENDSNPDYEIPPGTLWTCLGDPKLRQWLSSQN